MNFAAWTPLLRALISSPHAGGTLTRAYIERLSQLSRKPVSSFAAIDMTELDDTVEGLLG
jgi:hypothetical protein